MHLAAELGTRFARDRGKYGPPQLTADMRGLHARQPRRSVRATDSRYSLVLMPNVLKQCLQDEAPDHVWLADITYAGNDERWLYVALVMDLYTPRLVGWAVSTTID